MTIDELNSYFLELTNFAGQNSLLLLDQKFVDLRKHRHGKEQEVETILTRQGSKH